jgi:hypothetical protein
VKLNAFPGENFEGVVEYIGQQTDPVARTLTARIRLKNAGALGFASACSASAHVEVAEAEKVALRKSSYRASRRV